LERAIHLYLSFGSRDRAGGLGALTAAIALTLATLRSRKDQFGRRLQRRAAHARRADRTAE
jgi:hypothetical protein